MIQTFADYVISKQSELKNINPEDVYSDRDILVQFFTLLMAGATTTGFTISWAFYYLGIKVDLIRLNMIYRYRVNEK